MILSLILIILFFFNNEFGINAFENVESSILQMLSVLPPVMLLLGLMDEWIPREHFMKYMGNNSGLFGIFLAMLIGSLAAGPMYAAFPFTAVLMKKGVKFSNIIIFMNAWCVTKISTLLFEISALGFKFTLVRLLINVPGVIIIGLLVHYIMNDKDLNDIYENSKTL